LSKEHLDEVYQYFPNVCEIDLNQKDLPLLSVHPLCTRIKSIKSDIDFERDMKKEECEKIIQHLLSLTSLSKLSLHNIDRRVSLTFLSKFDSLINLSLYFSWIDHHDPLIKSNKLESIANSIIGCHHLTRLFLDTIEFNSTHLTTILTGLPSLTSLELNYLTELTSLKFLSAASKNLTQLHLHGISNTLPEELLHTIHCRNLTHLTVHCDSFQYYSIPSSLYETIYLRLPLLTKKNFHFDYQKNKKLDSLLNAITNVDQFIHSDCNSTTEEKSNFLLSRTLPTNLTQSKQQ
jgi:hypothetical protein